MRLSIHHTTRYTFDTPVTYGLQQLRKTPKTGHGQEIIRWQTTVTNGKKEVQYHDHFNNVVDLISIDRGATDLVITCEGEVQLAETTGIVGQHRGPAPLWFFETQTNLTKPGPGVRALARQVSGETDLERLHDLSRVIREAVDYTVGVSHSEWTAEMAIDAAQGVCQDHSHIFVAAARVLGFPARYVSGYLKMDDRVAQDATHAWAEAHIDALGWVGFDISNGISPDTRYVRVATGLDYTDAAPVTGTRIGGAGESLSVEIHVAQQ